jgi:hypothetical protein
MDIYCDDIENYPLEIKTEPRNQKPYHLHSKSIRVPLKGLKINNNENQFTSEKFCLSEPVNNLKCCSRIIQKKYEALDENERHKQEESKLCKVKPKKLTASILAEILNHDTFIEDELGFDESDEHILFNFLENEGRLSPEVLKTFCKSTKIRNVNMTRSYAGTKCESGLISAPKYSAKLCTKPFYYGFQQLLSIDFTNVKICDDELRYLIRLPKLQALGLSGTLVTDKGIKYISNHSNFKLTLQCLKLCFLEGISDMAIKLLNVFTKLKSLDLRGNKNISLASCLDIITDRSEWRNSDIFIKLPDNLHHQLSELHFFYEELLSKNDSKIIIDPSDNRISQLSKSEIKSQLFLHKKSYSDIYLNQDMEYLQKKLIEIIKRRKKEEFLYSYNAKK